MREHHFILYTPEILEHMVSFLRKHMGGERPLEVVVRPYYQKRTLDQNARLWMLHGKAGEHVGCPAEEMHEDMLCMVYGYREVKMPSGDVKRIPLQRSSMRNRKEFAKFMEQVEAFYISELGVWLDQEAA